MTEQAEPTESGSQVELLPAVTTRELVLIRGRSSLLTEPLDSRLVENEKGFGRGNDLASLFSIHESYMGPDQRGPVKLLGIRESTARRVRVPIDGQPVDFTESDPSVRTVWVGDNVRLFTKEEAEKIYSGGQTALKWATIGGKVPEMVVRARDGFFYPATSLDVTLPDLKR